MILGAGASYDVRTEASSVINVKLRPPLASGLFNTQNDEFWKLLNQYRPAAHLAQQIVSELERVRDLEELPRHYAFHSQNEIKQQFKYIPPYLRDLLSACSQRYTHEPSNYISLIHELLVERSFEVLFLVLNYDDLLERALTGYSENYSFTEFDSYIRSDRPAKVIKVHGSIHWFRRLPGDQDWSTYLNDLDISVRPPNEQLLVHIAPHNTHQLSHNGSKLYPRLTAPLAGKGSSDIVCP